MEKQIFLADEQETVAFGGRLAEYVADSGCGITIYLQGTLGAGKTTFCRGFLIGLGHSSAVKSPTYTLVEPYDLGRYTAYHFDLYRLADPEELEYMGIRDYFTDSAICLIEWPQRGLGVLAKPDLQLSFDVSGSGRAVTLLAESNRGQAVIKGI